PHRLNFQLSLARRDSLSTLHTDRPQVLGGHTDCYRVVRARQQQMCLRDTTSSSVWLVEIHSPHSTQTGPKSLADIPTAVQLCVRDSNKCVSEPRTDTTSSSVWLVEIHSPHSTQTGPKSLADIPTAIELCVRDSNKCVSEPRTSTTSSSVWLVEIHYSHSTQTGPKSLADIPTAIELCVRDSNKCVSEPRTDTTSSSVWLVEIHSPHSTQTGPKSLADIPTAVQLCVRDSNKCVSELIGRPRSCEIAVAPHRLNFQLSLARRDSLSTLHTDRPQVLGGHTDCYRVVRERQQQMCLRGRVLFRKLSLVAEGERPAVPVSNCPTYGRGAEISELPSHTPVNAGTGTSCRTSA
ncbi:hypothetical protein J6590_092186, partial [Homalodisca vitripennis]